MPALSHVENSHAEHGTCRACGATIPLSDVILKKFRRCYHCAEANPFGTNWTAMRPAIVIAALTVLTVWWKQTFL